MTEAAPTEIRVGGPIRRVAVVTIRRNYCALYLARQLVGTGVDLTLVNQTRMRTETDSWAFFRRFVKKYGARLAFDYFLLFVVKGAARTAGRVLGRCQAARPVPRSCEEAPTRPPETPSGRSRSMTSIADPGTRPFAPWLRTWCCSPALRS